MPDEVVATEHSILDKFIKRYGLIAAVVLSGGGGGALGGFLGNGDTHNQNVLDDIKEVKLDIKELNTKISNFILVHSRFDGETKAKVTSLEKDVEKLESKH